MARLQLTMGASLCEGAVFVGKGVPDGGMYLSAQ